MSKSLGNIIDPLDVIDHVGADALRFSLMSMAAQGTDIYLSEQKFDIGRNFGNKIWNAARFILMNIGDNPPHLNPLPPKGGEGRVRGNYELPDRWILSLLHHTIEDVTKAFEKFQFNEASRLIYEFFWSDFCDWYIEVSKLRIKEQVVQEILLTVLEATLKLLHPIMPFITEEVWQKLPGARESIMTTPWPKVNQQWYDSKSEIEMGFLIKIITALRTLRSELNVGTDKKPKVFVKGHSKEELKIAQTYQEMIQRFSSLSEISYGDQMPTKQVAMVVVGNLEIYLLMEGIIDLETERKHLAKEIESLQEEINAVEGRLVNKSFIEKAHFDVVNGEKKKKQILEAKKERFKRHLASL
jgi:valyl-tRNA synthetase